MILTEFERILIAVLKKFGLYKMFLAIFGKPPWVKGLKNKLSKDEEAALIEQLKEQGIFERFATIYADPPWPRWQNSKKRGALRHYKLMDQQAIEDMPIEYLAAPNAHLYLWVPDGLIDDALAVMKAWGFSPRNIIGWPKPNALPLGNYFRNNLELVVFGVRGKAPVKFHGHPNMIYGPRQEHSHKPEEAFATIERMSNEPYLELFARRQPMTTCRDNWSVWGNEIESDIYIPGYPVPKYSERAILPEGVSRVAEEVSEDSKQEEVE